MKNPELLIPAGNLEKINKKKKLMKVINSVFKIDKELLVILKGHLEIEKSLDIIIEESKNLKELVNSMILLTKLEDSKEKFIFKEQLLFSVIEDVLNKYKLIAKNNNIEIEINIEKGILLKYDCEYSPT